VNDPYRVLGVQPGASPEAIRSAYFELVRAHPPERDAEAFKIVRAAYEQLCEQLSAPEAHDELFELQAPPVWQTGHVKSAIDAELHPEDVLVALHGWADLAHRDFSDDFREVTL
jgi:hypothetical protein